VSSAPAILTVQGLEKHFGDRRVLRGVSLAIHPRERIGLIGVNGGGKSTLLKMIVAGAIGGRGVDDGELAGLEPDAGQITWRRDLRLEYVTQEPRFAAGVTIGELLARDGDVPAHEASTIAAALQLPAEDRRVDQLSGGERRRVALARALLGKADLLALDEPTNHLDARTVEWLEQRLGNYPGAVLVVTHDRYFLDRVVTRVVELDRGQVYSHDGDYSSFLLAQAERLATEADTEHKRAMFVRREIEWVRRSPAARSTKQKARLDRFDEAVAKAPLVDEQQSRAIELRLPAGPRLGSTILEVRGAAKRLAGKQLFDKLTFTMKPGDRIGIVGPNGAGKTTLIRTLLGELPLDAGTATLGQNTVPAYLEQGRQELRDDLTVLDEVAGGNSHVELEDGPIHVRTFLRQLGFADASADTRVDKLSGGERNRVQLARLLRRGGNLLVLDEPTNDLDLMTLGALEHALCNFRGCALIVSHDRWFLDRVATGILAFEGGAEFGGDGQVTFYEGDYTSYAAKRRAPLAAPRAEKASKAPPSKGGKPAGPRKLSFKEARELEGMEAAIAAAEAAVVTAEATLSDPATFRERAAEMPQLVAALDAARAEVERLYARWQELESLAATAGG
jgi:ATP-binding cassette subfamily F protein uup